MNEVMKMTRKAVTVAVVAATIAWSVSLSAFLAPLAAQAATAGSLVKASMPAVYYVGNDGKRYVFPNEKTYKTWYSDFSGVVTITDSELAAMSIGGNVTYKPGVLMVKITTDPKVYAVASNGQLRWVTSEAVAVALYGSSWNHMIQDVPDAFFTNYTVGSDIASTNDFSPSGASSAATSINSDKGLGSGPSVSGTLSATLSSGQPAGGTVPKGATGVNVLKLDVRNGGSSAATLDSLTVHRTGAGSTSDVANMYVYSGNDRLTTGRTVNTSTNDAAFSGLNLSLASGQTKTLWIAVDFSSMSLSSDVDAFSVTSLLSGSTLASGLPLSGPSFTISGASVGTLAVQVSGTITNPKAGQLGAKVAQFTVVAGSAEDLTLSRIALYQSGSIGRDKLSNFALKQAGLTVATVSALNSKDLAVFALANPLTIAKGDSRVFEVYADISGAARISDTLNFYVDQTTDVLATGNTFGYGVMVNTNSGSPAGSYDGSSSFSSSSTIDAGQLTISFNGPASKDVAANSKNVEIFNFTMAAQANLEVKNLHLVLTGNHALDDGSSNSRLTNIQVVDTATSAAVMGPKDANQGTGYASTWVDGSGDAAGTSLLNFNDVFDMSAGTSRTFKVTANVANTTTVGELSTVKVALGTFVAADIRNLDSSTNLATSDIVPNSAISGNTINLKAPTLVLSASSTPVAQTYIKGTQGASLMGFSLKAGDGADIKVNTITVQGWIDTNDASGTCTVGPDTNFHAGRENAACASVADIAQTLKLWNGTTQIGSTKSPSSGASADTGGLVTFDNLNLTVPAGQSLNLILSGNLSSSMATATLPDVLQFRMVGSSQVTATDVDGNTVAPSGIANGNSMTVSDTGSATLTKAPDDTESEAGLVVGGSSNVVLAKFKIAAQNEELKLSKVRMHVATANTTSSLSLYDGSTLVGGPVSVDGSGNADFSGMTAFIVPKDGNKTLTVKGLMNTVGSSGSATGTLATVTMRDGGASSINAGTFEMRGTSSGSSTVLTSFGTNTAAVSTYTLADAACVAAETYTATIGGTPVVYTALTADCTGSDTADTVAILAKLTTAINANGTVAALVHAVATANTITLTALTTGTAGNSVATVAADTSSAGTLVATHTTLLTGSEGDIVGNPKVVRRTKPTVSLVALPSTTLTAGQNVVLRFTVSADAADNVALKGLTAVITNGQAAGLITNINTSDSGVRRVGDASNLAGTSALETCTFGTAVCTFVMRFGSEEVIAAGTSRTYEVRITTTAAAAADAISARLLGDSTLATGLLTAGDATHADTVGGTLSAFVWSDNSDTTTTDSSPAHIDTIGSSSQDWANGTYVKVIPTDTQTISK